MRPRRGAVRGGRGPAAWLALLVALANVAPQDLRAQEEEGTRVEGGLYLFHYQPVDLEGAESNTEVYAAFVSVEHRAGPWTVFAQGRARDTRLRDFFPGNVWLQEAWASYRVGDGEAPGSLVLRAGKMYQALGRFWDASFFGNIHYFDGLKLNPQFAVEAAGTAAPGEVALTWQSQLVLDSDRVSGAFRGRDFETLDGFKDQYSVTGRVAAAFPGGLGLGLSAMSRRFEEAGAAPGGEPEAHRVLHLAVDGQVDVGDFSLYGEWMQRGDGGLPSRLGRSHSGSEATYLLAGVQWEKGRLQARYNFSRADYDDLDREEWIHQPGVTVDVAENLTGILELDVWRGRDGDGDDVAVDQSLNFVLLLHF